MRWEKLGRVFAPGDGPEWMAGRVSMPSADRIAPDRLRLTFGALDDAHRYRAGWIDVDPADPTRVLAVAERPSLDLGDLGCFDDGGVLPSSIVTTGGRRLLYYIGWNRRETPGLFLNAIGLAASTDAGTTWTRVHRGPVVDRTRDEPHFTSAPWVHLADGRWRMWYLNGVEWLVVDGVPEPRNHLKYAESDDGERWRRDGIVAVDLTSREEGGISRPTVVADPDRWRMWYCHRALAGYRTDRERSYRMGYAESADGVVWRRRDDEAGIDVSSDGWDSEMIEFPCVTDVDGRRYLFYNGNGFGATGIGAAVARV